jgi:hypothetical protein
MRSHDYSGDVLAAGRRRPPQIPQLEAEPGLVVEDAEGRFCGAVVGCDKGAVTLEDRYGKRRVFPLNPAAFLFEGRPVTLVRPAAAAPAAPARPTRTASGSVAPPQARARVARASRIYVEGRHDAELVEKIWGDDLRDVGVVVEYLEGVDHLPEVLAEAPPGPGRRLGVLVDHLVPGSKESRIAAGLTRPDLLIVGHPYIDIWQAVKPSVVGIERWPDVPRGQPWKEGVLAAIGWTGSTAAAWQRILGTVRTFADLEPELLGRVEELIDFVTELSRYGRTPRRAVGHRELRGGGGHLADRAAGRVPDPGPAVGVRAAARSPGVQPHADRDGVRDLRGHHRGPAVPGQRP